MQQLPFSGDGVIVLATYEPNPELFAIQLRSIMNQSVKSWSCVVTHDPSKNCTMSQLEELVNKIASNDQRFKVLKNSKRLGFYDNFARGLEAAKEQFPHAIWVALSDQDDNWYSDKLEKLLPHLEEYTLVSGQARVMKYTSKTTELELLKVNTERKNCSFLRLFLRNEYSGALTVFRASLLDDILPFPGSFSKHKVHDHLIALTAARGRGAAVVNEVVQDYIQHENNTIGELVMSRTLMERACHFPYILFLQWRFTLLARLFPALGVIPGVLVAAVLATVALNSTSAIPQLFDEVFHLNAVRFIMDTGNWSPFRLINMENGAFMTGLAPPSTSFSAANFYPSGYHTLAAILGTVFGVPATAACFALNFVAIALIFPVGVAPLTASFVPQKLKFQAHLFGAIAASITAPLPYRLLTWGGIWPFAFGLQLLPLCIWITHKQSKLLNAMLSVVVIIPVLGMIHPSVALIYLLILLVVAWQKCKRKIPLAALTAVFVAAWIILRPNPDNYNLSTIANPLVAVGMYFLNVASKHALAVPVIFSIFVILGVCACARSKKTRWLVILWIIFLSAYVLTLSTSSNLRALLTGVIYANPHRMIATTGVICAPLAAFGLLFLHNRLNKPNSKFSELVQKLFKFKDVQVRRRAVSILVVGALVAVSALQLGTTSALEARSATNLDFNNRLSSDDVKLMHLIGDKLSAKNSLILADANQGGSLNYAISGVRTLPTHAFFRNSDELSYLFANLNKRENLAISCQYVQKIERADKDNPRTLLVLEIPDSKLDLLAGEVGTHFEGLKNLENTIGAEVVLEVGRARLVRPVCG